MASSRSSLRNAAQAQIPFVAEAAEAPFPQLPPTPEGEPGARSDGAGRAPPLASAMMPGGGRATVYPTPHRAEPLPCRNLKALLGSLQAYGHASVRCHREGDSDAMLLCLSKFETLYHQFIGLVLGSVKICSCDRAYTQSQWALLPTLKGRKGEDYERELGIEMKTCPSCKSTIGLPSRNVSSSTREETPDAP